MSKISVNINGRVVQMDLGRKAVQDAVANLIEACAVREFPIGLILTHRDNDGGCTDYELVKVHDRAYLANLETGIMRNSRKVVIVQGTSPKKSGKNYFVTEIPAEKDKFYDPENPGQFLDC